MWGAKYWTQGLEYVIYTVPLNYAPWPLYLFSNKYNYIRNGDLNNAMKVFYYICTYIITSIESTDNKLSWKRRIIYLVSRSLSGSYEEWFIHLWSSSYTCRYFCNWLFFFPGGNSKFSIGYELFVETGSWHGLGWLSNSKSSYFRLLSAGVLCIILSHILQKIQSRCQFDILFNLKSFWSKKCHFEHLLNLYFYVLMVVYNLYLALYNF